MNSQMIRVISSPSSSTTGFFTLIFAILRSSCRAGLPFTSGGGRRAGAADAIARAFASRSAVATDVPPRARKFRQPSNDRARSREEDPHHDRTRPRTQDRAPDQALDRPAGARAAPSGTAEARRGGAARDAPPAPPPLTPVFPATAARRP